MGIKDDLLGSDYCVRVVIRLDVCFMGSERRLSVEYTYVLYTTFSFQRIFVNNHFVRRKSLMFEDNWKHAHNYSFIVPQTARDHSFRRVYSDVRQRSVSRLRTDLELGNSGGIENPWAIESSNLYPVAF